MDFTRLKGALLLACVLVLLAGCTEPTDTDESESAQPAVGSPSLSADAKAVNGEAGAPVDLSLPNTVFLLQESTYKDGKFLENPIPLYTEGLKLGTGQKINLKEGWKFVEAMLEWRELGSEFEIDLDSVRVELDGRFITCSAINAFVVIECPYGRQSEGSFTAPEGFYFSKLSWENRKFRFSGLRRNFVNLSVIFAVPDSLDFQTIRLNGRDYPTGTIRQTANAIPVPPSALPVAVEGWVAGDVLVIKRLDGETRRIQFSRGEQVVNVAISAKYDPSIGRSVYQKLYPQNDEAWISIDGHRAREDRETNRVSVIVGDHSRVNVWGEGEATFGDVLAVAERVNFASLP